MANLESWIKSRLSSFAMTQPDWEQETVDELTSYLVLLAESTKDEAALSLECQDFLQDFLGPATSGFIEELCNRIKGTPATPSNATATTRKDSRFVTGLKDLTPCFEKFGFSLTIDRPASRHDESQRPHKQDAFKRKRDDRSRSPPHRRSDTSRHTRTASSHEHAGQSNSHHDQRRVNSLTAATQTTNNVDSASQPPAAPAGSNGAGQTPTNFSRAYASGHNAQSSTSMAAQQTGDDGSGFNNLPVDQMSAFFPPVMPFAGSFGNLIPMPCPNYTMFGFCLTADCAFIHDGSMQMPLFQPQAMPASQATQTRRETFTKSDMRNNHSIMVLNIPSENLKEADVRSHFSKFGKIMKVEFPEQGIAVLTYTSNEAAYRAKVSPEPIFNNRFVTTRWYKGSLPESSQSRNGHHNNIDWQSSTSEAGLRKLAEARSQARSQATQQRSYLTDLELRKTTVEQEIIEHDQALRKLKRQIKTKTRTSPIGTDEDDMESSDGDDQLERAAITRKKLVLQAELASIEATQRRQQAQHDHGAGSFMQLQPIHRIDNRPRRFRITLDTGDESDDPQRQEAARILQRVLMAQTVPPESIVTDGEILASTAEIQPDHEVIELGFEHHWQARRLLEQVADRLEDKVTVSWIDDNTPNSTVATGQARVVRSVDQSENDHVHGDNVTKRRTDRIDEADEERHANLDVAEEEDWMYE